jgi:transcriptional regulator
MTRSVPPDLLPGTLDLLILRILTRGPMHGYGIAQRLKLLSQDVLQVGESSLYPALQRLLLNGYLDAEWGISENNRRARFYTLTKAGHKRLAGERAEFNELVSAINRVLERA